MTIETAKALVPEGSHVELDQLLKLNLDSESIVIIIGSYQGLTAHILQEAYDCKIFCFDPQIDMNEQARNRLNGNAQVFDYGLANKDGVFPMVEVGTDAATFHTESSNRQAGEGRVRNVLQVWEELGLSKKVDLILFNCEGSEFGILQSLYDQKLLDGIQYLMVQFHLATVKGNGKNYDFWVERFEKLGFDVIWTVGAPWTLWGKDQIETLIDSSSENFLTASVEEDRSCPREDCKYVVTPGKNVPSALAGHKRSHR